jgi:hypothetical protein
MALRILLESMSGSGMLLLLAGSLKECRRQGVPSLLMRGATGARLEYWDEDCGSRLESTMA